METLQPLPAPVELPSSNALAENNQAQIVNDQALKTESLTTDTAIIENPSAQKSLVQRVGRSVAARATTEVAGIGVDALLMGAGSAGVGLLENVAARESLASATDVAILNKLKPKEEHGKVPQSRMRRMGHLAIMMATAVAAQKIGPGVAEHVSANLGHGFVGHFALPLSSKVGATSAVNSVLKRPIR